VTRQLKGGCGEHAQRPDDRVRDGRHPYHQRLRRRPRGLTAGQIIAAVLECERLELLRRAGGTAGHPDFNVEAAAGGFHAQHSGETVGAYDRLRKVMHPDRHSGWFAELAQHRLIVELARLVYPDPELVGSVLWFKPPRVGSAKPLHQDAAYLPVDRREQLSVWIALDDATPDNGCLQMLPGSHRAGLLPHTGREPQLPDPGELQPVLVPLTAGDAVVFTVGSDADRPGRLLLACVYTTRFRRRRDSGRRAHRRRAGRS